MAQPANLCPCGLAVDPLMKIAHLNGWMPYYYHIAPETLSNLLSTMPQVLIDLIMQYYQGCTEINLFPCSGCGMLAAIAGATDDRRVISKKRSCEPCRAKWRENNNAKLPDGYSYDLYTIGANGSPVRLLRVELDIHLAYKREQRKRREEEERSLYYRSRLFVR